jgi:hypothetical protein
LAVLKYLKETGRCTNWGIIKDYNNTYNETLKYYHDYYWQDTVKDSTKTPFDTTLPTIDDLDLGILRGPNKVFGAPAESRIGLLFATRNPFTETLELAYHLDKSAMVRIDIYDLLGKAVHSEGQGYKQSGEYELSIQTNDWPSGSYFVRLSTPSGEVKTVKVIKE